MFFQVFHQRDLEAYIKSAWTSHIIEFVNTMFDFEKLAVYQKAKAFNSKIKMQTSVAYRCCTGVSNRLNAVELKLSWLE
ncbi:hypothetical protein GCM10009122_61440 [Fulvivirga kasyanovii]